MNRSPVSCFNSIAVVELMPSIMHLANQSSLLVTKSEGVLSFMQTKGFVHNSFRSNSGAVNACSQIKNECSSFRNTREEGKINQDPPVNSRRARV
jgi:hypothetical protein